MVKKATRRTGNAKKKPAKSKTVTKKKVKAKKKLPTTFYDIKNPTEVNKMISQFKDFATKNNCIVVYEGKNYINISGWQFAGSLLGFRTKITNTKKELSQIGEIVFSAQASLVDADGRMMVEGVTMYCSSSEDEKYKTISACASMAQTRAQSKTYRMAIGWIVEAAGFETTPSEEMGIRTKGISEMYFEDFVNLFAGCETVDEVMSVDQVNKKKYKSNYSYRMAFEEAGRRCKLNQTGN